MVRFGALAGAVFLTACSNDIGDDLADAALATPTAFTGTPLPDGTAVILSWADNATAETGYRLDVSDIPISQTADVTAVRYLPANSTTTTWGTPPGATRWYRVLALTATHQSKPSPVISVQTPVVPQPVGSLVATSVSSSQIDVTWWDGPSETGYRLERRPEGSTSWATVTTPAAGSTVFNDTGLLGDVEYFYRIFAFNADGESAPSNVASAPTVSASMDIAAAATSGSVGTFSSIAVDGAGKEHISHYDGSFTNVLYTTNVSGAFTTSTVDWGLSAVTEVGIDGTSLALDGAGKVHVAAVNYTDGDLRYITDAAGAFAASTADSTGWVGSRPKLRISPADGSIQVVYRAETFLKRATLSGGIWSFELITPSEFIEEIAFALDGSGTPHVSYQRYVNGGGVFKPELVYGTKAGGTWTFAVLPTAGDPHFNVIAVDPSGAPHIVYSEMTTQGLHHAWLSAGAWTSEPIDLSAGVMRGRYCSLAIDGSVNAGRLHVAYHDSTALDLRYARKDPGGAWVRRILEAAGSVGSHTSIAVDGAGAIHVSYYDQTNADLRRASGSP